MSGGSPAAAAAKKKGLEVVYPSGRQLFVDLDDADGMKTFLSHVEILRQHVPLSYEIRKSASGEPWHHHATVLLHRDVNNLERIALQAVLGSDRLHEVLSLMSLMFKGEERPTCFFEKKLPSPKLPEFES